MNTRNQLMAWPVFRETWGPLAEILDDWMLRSPRTVPESRLSPACEVEEIEDHYLLSLEVPGMKKDDLKIEFVDGQIVISGERRFENKKRLDSYYYSERGTGKFQRSFKLPLGIDADKVEANYQDGILQILVPKAESAKPRQIKIAHGTAGTNFFGKLLGPKGKEEDQSSSKLTVTANDKVAS